MLARKESATGSERYLHVKRTREFISAEETEALTAGRILERVSPELTERMEHEKATLTFNRVAFRDEDIIRRHDVPKDEATVWRPAFVHDIDKILHCPYYNRYADKTQAFSFFRNDDISRRSLHVQLVSRIARTIGVALNLNLDLIEAIALGHDIGHAPFAHTGERLLDEIYCENTGRHFAHNIHSVRVLDEIFPINVSLQTLDGIASHNGETELLEYRPVPLDSFEVFDRMIEECYVEPGASARLVPSTLEGCVVRISDIIAYLGRDRQDAEKAQIAASDAFERGAIGVSNTEIINNLIVNIIENSYGKPYVCMDRDHFAALKAAKTENYKLIYGNEKSRPDPRIRQMMAQIYDLMKKDLIAGREHSPVYTHHINYILPTRRKRRIPYEENDPDQIVVDYIASMTDDYFVDLYNYLFPKSPVDIKYVGYFDADPPYEDVLNGKV